MVRFVSEEDKYGRSRGDLCGIIDLDMSAGLGRAVFIDDLLYEFVERACRKLLIIALKHPDYCRKDLWNVMAGNGADEHNGKVCDQGKLFLDLSYNNIMYILFCILNQIPFIHRYQTGFFFIIDKLEDLLVRI